MLLYRLRCVNGSFGFVALHNLTAPPKASLICFIHCMHDVPSCSTFAQIQKTRSWSEITQYTLTGGILIKLLGTFLVVVLLKKIHRIFDF